MAEEVRCTRCGGLVEPARVELYKEQVLDSSRHVLCYSCASRSVAPVKGMMVYTGKVGADMEVVNDDTHRLAKRSHIPDKFKRRDGW